MTPEQRAEEIMQKLANLKYWWPAVLQRLIEEALEAAEAEAVNEDRRQYNERIDSVVKEIRSAAYEECAKIAESFNASYFMQRVHLVYGPVNETIAKEIRRSAAERP